MNVIEQKINDDQSCRFLYPTGAFVWFIGGATNDPILEGLMRYRILRDLEGAGKLARKQNQMPVALLTETMATPLVTRMLPRFYDWGSVRFGRGELEVENPDLVCALSADLVIVYGEETDRLQELLGERDEEKHGPEPEIIVRDIKQPVRVKQTIHTEANPYGKFWGDVERLRNWSYLKTHGLQIREMIDMRPKFNL